MNSGLLRSQNHIQWLDEGVRDGDNVIVVHESYFFQPRCQCGTKIPNNERVFWCSCGYTLLVNPGVMPIIHVIHDQRSNWMHPHRPRPTDVFFEPNEFISPIENCLATMSTLLLRGGETVMIGVCGCTAAMFLYLDECGLSENDAANLAINNGSWIKKWRQEQVDRQRKKHQFFLSALSRGIYLDQSAVWSDI